MGEKGGQRGTKTEILLIQSRVLTSLVYGIAISEIAPAISDFALEKVTRATRVSPRNLHNSFSPPPPHIPVSFHFVRNNGIHVGEPEESAATTGTNSCCHAIFPLCANERRYRGFSRLLFELDLSAIYFQGSRYYIILNKDILSPKVLRCSIRLKLRAFSCKYALFRYCESRLSSIHYALFTLLRRSIFANSAFPAFFPFSIEK